MQRRMWFFGLLLAFAMMSGSLPAAPQDAAGRLLAGDMQWSASAPLVGPLDRVGDHFYSVKDPSFVKVGKQWHVFCTVRGKNRPQQIEYLTFTDWNATEKGERHLLPITEDYYCAPTVFYFTPQKKWYLIYQYSPGSRTDRNRLPAFSTNRDVGDWKNWTSPVPLYNQPGRMVKNWIDFWVICDAQKAYLFFTCDDGTMWRAETSLMDFPHGWSQPVLALKGDIFEASHTYHIRGTQKYLTIIEAVGGGRRYYKAYSANALNGKWQPVAAGVDKPFAGRSNVVQPSGYWTDSISHGELFRAGIDEKMEIEPQGLKMLFQGVSDEEMQGKPYGEIPWRLGILTPSERPVR